MEVPNPYEGRWRASGFEAGDAIIFHSMMVHKALPNVSTNLRQSIDNRYQAVHEPIVEASLLPYASVMPWEEIYAGWSSDRYKYYWKDTFKNIVPFSQKYYENATKSPSRWPRKATTSRGLPCSALCSATPTRPSASVPRGCSNGWKKSPDLKYRRHGATPGAVPHSLERACRCQAVNSAGN